MPKKEEKSSGAPEWMCTFSDMMSLLLCFFVLLFSMSTIDKKKMIQAVGSVRAAFGGRPSPYTVETIQDEHTPPELSRPAQPERRLSYAKDELRVEEQRKVRSWNLQNVIQVTGTEQGITFRISGDALFDRGKADLTVKGIYALTKIAEELIQFPSNPILIEGHTDNTPTPDQYGNWLLGANRAYNVMKYLVEMGCPFGQVNPKRIAYESYADTNPVPDVDENTSIGRSLNRRVEITLVQTDEGDGSYFRDPLVKNPRTPLIHLDDENL
ncbi:MAG: flagellar motor protein MotB [Candidatus Omnitrophica bacterium]|nr:flagellar motor protein MotB [Candidatus Omnitrophota bacterium]